ncbi:MAG: GNAT family N-acetyltransferase [Chroococcidiopsidaceae cyanobacterium CP_BM_RX_35]|nr:GNAT family N-acetyltransferase [Chroococcidiopsidaceae cyanobacterium CP_BM_RX_35]
MNQELSDRFYISTDKSLLNILSIHDFLKNSYWAENIPIFIVKKSIENSLCFGVYEGNKQIGFARVISDYATFAYIADVFVLEAYRGQGLGKWLIESILKHCDLQGHRRWLLATRDAHELYHRYEFQNLTKPEIFMELSKDASKLYNSQE